MFTTEIIFVKCCDKVEVVVVRSLSAILILQPKFLNCVRSCVDL